MERGRVFQIERTACTQAQGNMQLGMFLDVKEGSVVGVRGGRVVRDELGR